MSVRGVVWETDGEVVGLAGRYLLGGRTVIFSDAKPGLPKLAVWRAAKKFMAEVVGPAVCVTENSGPFLERLGWVKGEGEEYLWQP